MDNLTVASRAIGIDIGTSSVKVVSMQARLGALTIERTAEEPIEREPDGQVTPEAITDAIRAALESIRVRREVIVVGVSTQTAAVRSISIPFNDIAKARAVIKFQAEPHIPFPVEDVVMDFLDCGTGTEERMDVLLTAIRKPTIEEQIGLARGAGVDPEVLEVDFMGAVNTVNKTVSTTDRGVLLMDIGASKTIVAFLKDGVPLGLRAFPVGGEAMTNAIARDLKLSFEDAEKKKIERADASADPETCVDPNTAQAIKPVLDRFSGEIGRTLRFLTTQLSTTEDYKVILTGGGALMKGMPEFIRDIMGHEVEVLDDLEPIRNSFNAELSTTRFATAIGLALRGTGQTSFLQNFRKEELAYSRAYRRLQVSIYLTAFLLGAIVVTYLVGLFLNYRAAKENSSKLAFAIRSEIVSAVGDAPRNDNPSSLVERFKEQVEQKKDDLKDLTGTRPISVLNLLKTMSDVIDSEFEVMIEKLNITADPPILIMRGTALSDANVNEIVKKLEATNLFGEVTKQKSDWRESLGRRYFEIRAELR